VDHEGGGEVGRLGEMGQAGWAKINSGITKKDLIPFEYFGLCLEWILPPKRFWEISK
jgi:hypothetical protein